MKSFQSTVMVRFFVVCLAAIFLVACTVSEVNAKRRSVDEINKIRKIAENGDIEAQRLLGYIYSSDNKEESIYWLTKAAEQGDAEAQYGLGIDYYKDGENRKSFYWHSKAAEQGYHLSYFYLGYFYGDGIGVPQNYIYSYAWWSLDVSNSSTEFDLNNDSRYRDKIAKKLSPQQLAQAQELAAALQQKIDNRKNSVSQQAIPSTIQENESQNSTVDDIQSSEKEERTFKNLTWVHALFNVLTWFLVYLSIPLAIRYLILRRPIENKWIAIGILVPIFIGFSILIGIQREMGLKVLNQKFGLPSNQGPHMIGSIYLYVVMFLSYNILRRGHNNIIASKEKSDIPRTSTAMNRPIKKNMIGSSKNSTPINSNHSISGTQKCPYCAEEIKLEAIKCKHCGEMLNDKF